MKTKWYLYKGLEKAAFVVFHAARWVILKLTERLEYVEYQLWVAEQATKRGNEIDSFVKQMQRKAKVLGARREHERRVA